MTESEWLASEDPQAMLDDVTKRINPAHDYKISDRKLRLFACACRRQTPHEWDHGPPNCSGWLDIEECPERSIVGVPAIDHATLFISGSLDSRFCPPPNVAAALLREIVGNPFRPIDFDAAWRTETVLSLAQAAYNHSCPNRCCDPVPWGGCSDCRGSGRRPDGTLDPERLAVLADALEEAGCPMEVACPACEGRREVLRLDAAGSLDWEVCRNCLSGPGVIGVYATGRVPHPLLGHLRGPGPHVRGCWVLDLVLEKE